MDTPDYRHDKFLLKADSYSMFASSRPSRQMPPLPPSQTPNKSRPRFHRNKSRSNFGHSPQKNFGRNYSKSHYNFRRGRNQNRSNKFSNFASKNLALAEIERSTEPNSQLELELFKEEGVSKGLNFEDYDKIPVKITGQNLPRSISNFSEVNNIHPQLLWNIDRSGYTKPTPVQKHALPISISGKDIMGVAQTGSGKTAAFLLPMVQILLETGGRNFDDFRQILPIALILTPTRELAMQIQTQARKFLYCTGMRSCVVYGGVDINQQRRNMRGGVDILVATPGRLVDFLDRREIALGDIRFLVLDEADRMLDMGFELPLRKILGDEFGMPRAGKRQTMMFSATFPPDIQRLAERFMGDFAFVAVGRIGGAAESVKQQVIYAENADKPSILLDFFESIEGGAVLIFVERKIHAGRLENFLRSNGIRALSIHGDKSQREREFAINSFKKGICKVLVATDVASRGLDIPNVAFVVNYDMTNNIDDYVHRIGRTGRIGNEGVALTIISENENAKILEDLRKLLKDSNQKVPEWLGDAIYQRRNNSSRGRGRRQGNYGRRQNSNYGGRHNYGGQNRGR